MASHRSKKVVGLAGWSGVPWSGQRRRAVVSSQGSKWGLVESNFAFAAVFYSFGFLKLISLKS